MKIKVNKKVFFGSFIVAIAFSETLKNMTTWLFPFIMLFLISALYFMNIISGYEVTFGKSIFRKYFKFGILPYILILGYSCVVILINGFNSRLISRNIGAISIAIMVIIICASFLYIFKEKTPDILCYGLILNYFCRIIMKIPKIRLSGLIQHIINPLSTYENIFEQHSIGFSLNLLLIYYLMKNTSKDYKKIIVIIIAEYLIMKRIALVGLLFGFTIWFFLDFVLKKGSVKKYYMVYKMLFIASLGYVIFICLYPNLYRILMDKMGILNRYLFSASFFDYFKFDIRYLGHGYGFVSIMMPNMDIAGARVLAIHNDILKDYIELGFIGFVLAYFYLFVLCPKKLFENTSNRTVSCSLVIMCYCFITLLTDNTMDYVSFTCTLFSIFGVFHFYGSKLLVDKGKNFMHSNHTMIIFNRDLR